MNRWDMDKYRHKMHHFARFYLQNGETVEGNMQPWDDNYVYITVNNGQSGGKIRIADIQRIEFPNE